MIMSFAGIVRSPKGGRIVLRAFFLAGLVFSAPAFAQQTQTPASKAQTAIADKTYKGDPDYPVVKQVCTVCHSPEMWMHGRSWGQWTKIFDDMNSYGAKGTDDQWGHISNFFQANLTTLNVNTASPDEIAATLGISDDVAGAIVSRREKQKFTSFADLQSIRGIDPDRLKKIQPRLEF